MIGLGGAMKISTAFLASAIICVTLPMTMVTAADTPPRWAYIEDNPNYKPPVDDGNLVRVPNSTGLYLESAPGQIHRPGLAPGRSSLAPGYCSPGPQAQRVRLRILSSGRRAWWSGKRRPRRPSEELHHSPSGGL